MSGAVGVNLIGPASSNIGLGVITREFAKALLANGHPVSIFDLDVGGGRSKLDLSLAEHFVDSKDELPHDINIWVFSATLIHHNALEICASPRLKAQFNAAMVWWELPHVPPMWAESAQAFDAVLCATEFVRETWANHVSRTPVLLARSPLDMPAVVSPDRARFGLPAEPLLIYTGFEAASDPVRKNPLGAVEAFRQAFPNDSDVRLVIKVNNPSVDGKLQGALAQLYALIEDDARVILVTERLAYADLLSLYASCDVIISLHRSEGLGLIPLEAMRLSRAVVATGWSGNMTYMNHLNAGLVRFTLVPTDESATHYSPMEVGVQSLWAEPDVAHAAAWLRRFAADPDLRHSMGQQAAHDSALFNAAACRTEFVHELYALNDQRPWLPAKDHDAIQDRIRRGMRHDELRRLSAPWRQFVRARRSVMRQIGRHVTWRFQGRT